MAIIRIKNIEDLRLPSKELMVWSRSKIYYKNGEYLKILNAYDRPLKNKVNYNRFKVLEELSRLEDIRYLELPQNMYITDDEFLGYSMHICEGNPFLCLPDNVLVDSVISMLNCLLEDLKKVSTRQILNPDIWSGNVLFDGYCLHLIDFDDCIYFDDVDMAYKIMGMNLFNLVIDRMVDSYNLSLLNDIDINYIKMRIDSLKSADYVAFINLLKLKLTRRSQEKIETVGDIRRCLKIG